MPSHIFNPVATRIARLLDTATELVLYGMIVFAPWAFGSTQTWSIRCMNVAGYLLGMLLAGRVWARRADRVAEIRIDQTPRITLALKAATLTILAYCLVAAVNAEFTYIPWEWRQEPHPHVHWLPHSLDRNASWQVFWNWLAIAGTFWAVHDWLCNDIAPDGHRSLRRLRRLVFALTANAALVAFEGILQRVSDTPKLLWFKATHDNPSAASQFGPYAYRANAAQFFNLIWPAALGLWWQLHLQRAGGSRRVKPHHWLLPCALLLIAAPLISMSRGGVAVAIVEMCACCGIVLAGKKVGITSKLSMVLVFLASLGLASYVGWDQLAKRLHDTAADPLGGRRETYELAARMTQDYPWFGVGPGAFDSVFQLYRNSPDDYWPAQLHDDWLEYQITFGRIGCALLLVGGALVGMRWFIPGGLRMHWTFPAFIWIGIGGCLLHARFDFPLQIYSIQFVFILLCALLFSVSRPGSGRVDPA